MIGAIYHFNTNRTPVNGVPRELIQYIILAVNLASYVTCVILFLVSVSMNNRFCCRKSVFIGMNRVLLIMYFV